MNFLCARFITSRQTHAPKPWCRRQLVCVDFTATWCGPCKTIAPKVAEMAGMYECQFLKVDVDENEETTIACNITNMPTFQFYKVPPSLTHTHTLARSLSRSLCRSLSRSLSRALSLTLFRAHSCSRAHAHARSLSPALPPPPPISLSLHLSLPFSPSLSSPHAPGICPEP
jgi:hypothetical protein